LKLNGAAGWLSHEELRRIALLPEYHLDLAVLVEFLEAKPSSSVGAGLVAGIPGPGVDFDALERFPLRIDNHSGQLVGPDILRTGRHGVLFRPRFDGPYIQPANSNRNHESQSTQNPSR